MKNWEERTVIFGCWIFLWFLGLVFGGWVYSCRGHHVARIFGLGGQESLRNPGARELDRLLLASWVVSRFWAGFGQSIKQSLGRAVERTIRGWEFSIRQRYFYVRILMNM
jgi:hypothetical protein